MLDRTKAPLYNPLKPVSLLRPQFRELEGGTKLYYIDGTDADLVRIEFIFPHAGWDPSHPLTAQALAGMLLEGTSRRTASEIAEHVDFFGAFLNADCGADHTILTLHCLNSQVRHLLPLVKEVLTDSVFPERELSVYCRNSSQKLRVSLEKNDFQARRAFNRSLFGQAHPYGYKVEPSDFEKVERDRLLKHYPVQFRSGNCTMIAAGKIDQALLEELEKLFGQNDWTGKDETLARPPIPPALSGKERVEMPGSLQTAIRIGKAVVNKTHPDHPALQVLNTVLGGYFGSRLMANIREDKGYTYGIGSGLHSLQETGLFFIATEVGSAVSGQALEEIYKEVARLREEEIPAEELDLVRNYMMGTFLGSLENVFSHADKLKGILLFGLDYEYYERYFRTIQTVEAGELQQLARQYLTDSFLEVTAG